MSKNIRILSLILAVLLAVSAVTVSAGAVSYGESFSEESVEKSADTDLAETGLDTSKCLNFDVSTCYWKYFEKIGFYICEVGGREWKPWGSKDLFKSEETSDGIWSFDPEANGVELWSHRQYFVIFINRNNPSLQTAPLLFDTTCLGDTAVCTGKQLENELDSGKTSLETKWKNNELGSMKVITSTGKIVGETVPYNTTPYEMLISYLRIHLENARYYSHKDDQTLLDEAAKELGLSDQEVAAAIQESGVEGIVWKPLHSGDSYGYIKDYYYAFGSIFGDNSGISKVHKDMYFTDAGGKELKISGVKLKAGDKLNVARYIGGGRFSIYPDGKGREMNINKTGVYDLFFKPFDMGSSDYWYFSPMYIGEIPPTVTVSGKVTSYLNDTYDSTVSLIRKGDTAASYSVSVNGNSAAYRIDDVEPGEYILRVSKINHVDRDYKLTVGSSDKTQDVQICPLGDVNGDGKTTQFDYSFALAYSRRARELNEYQYKCGDVFGVKPDGKLTTSDASRILQHVRKAKLLY